jgi:transcriptional regulator with GAF, ATPase, and Fis domain
VLPDSFNAGDAEGLTRSAEALPTLAEAERVLIQQALATTEWRIEGEAGAARVLGLNPSTLRSRMKKHGIRRPS